MLHNFIIDHRSEIIRRARLKVESRCSPRPTHDELQHGVPLFLDQLCESLRLTTLASTEAIRASAARHGADLALMGFTIGQVVHDYGDICQAVTELAQDLDAEITVDEFHAFNRCLDEAIAGAVTEFSRLRQDLQANQEIDRASRLAHELRNRLGAVMLAYGAMKEGRVGIGGSTAAAMERNLRALRDLIDASMVRAQVETGKLNSDRISVTEIVDEIAADASLSARERGMTFSLAPVQPGLEVNADRTILAAATANLIQNAFKYSRTGGQVTLTISATSDRVLFEVEDECGGLVDGKTEELFEPFLQASANRSGLGLGLAISRSGIEANGGEVHARDLPGKGCVFTIAVPHATPRS